MLHKTSSSKSTNTTHYDRKACHIQFTNANVKCHKGTEHVSEEKYSRPIIFKSAQLASFFSAQIVNLI